MSHSLSGRRPARPALLLAATALVLCLLGVACAARAPQVSPPSTPTLSPTATEPILPAPPTGTPTTPPTATEPILPAPPTHTPTTPPGTTPATPASAAAPSPALSPTPGVPAHATPAVRITSSPAPPATPAAALYSARQRLGVGASTGRVTAELADRLGLGWYLNWGAQPDAYRAPGVEYVPMIRVREGELWPRGQALLAAVDALPGALWIIGNEPDVRWQDNTPAETYAAAYYQAYTLLKERDPSCRVAIGGVSQPTPLRLRYLDQVLAAYEAAYGEPMPVDVWNVHNFVLREERDSWGVDIPPGMDDPAGRLYEIADHDEVEIFWQQIVDMRQWMKERGQQDKPLIVSEFGLLMPNEYGFPPERVERFMLDTFERLRTTADPALGYPADGYRLVQRWCWFSLADPRYPTGNLLTAADGSLTPLGEAFATYAASLR